jgi:hypothetical protein
MRLLCARTQALADTASLWHAAPGAFAGVLPRCHVRADGNRTQRPRLSPVCGAMYVHAVESMRGALAQLERSGQHGQGLCRWIEKLDRPQLSQAIKDLAMQEEPEPAPEPAPLPHSPHPGGLATTIGGAE